MTDAIPPEVAAAMEAYRAAFERFDSRALAGFFAYPCHITGDAAQTAISSMASKEDYVRAIDRLLDHYRTVGVASGRIVEVAATGLSPGLLQLRVVWDVCSRTGEQLYRFTGLYTWARVSGRWSITAIAHDELPKLQACLAERRGKRP